MKLHSIKTHCISLFLRCGSLSVFLTLLTEKTGDEREALLSALTEILAELEANNTIGGHPLNESPALVALQDGGKKPQNYMPTPIVTNMFGFGNIDAVWGYSKNQSPVGDPHKLQRGGPDDIKFFSRFSDIVLMGAKTSGANSPVSSEVVMASFCICKDQRMFTAAGMSFDR